MFLIVADMHELTLIHTDLKPENILLVSSEYVKVPDYKVWKYSEITRYLGHNCFSQFADKSP